MNRSEALQAIRQLGKSDFDARIASQQLGQDRQDLLFVFIKGGLPIRPHCAFDIEQYALKCLMPDTYALLPCETHPFAANELFEYDPPKNGQNLIKHGIGFGEVVSYSRQFGTLMVPCSDGQDGERTIVFSDLNLLREEDELALPPPGIKDLNYTMSVTHLRDGKFRFISSRLMSSKEQKYRKTMAQAFGEIIPDAQARSGFIDRCVELVERDLIRPPPATS